MTAENAVENQADAADETSAGRIIDLFGGPTELAALLRIDRSTVACWKIRTGRIPSKYFKRILAAADQQQIQICVDDLIP